jgi:hypothetical protein
LNEIVRKDRGAEHKENRSQIIALTVLLGYQYETGGAQGDMNVAEHVKIEDSGQQVHRAKLGLKS